LLEPLSTGLLEGFAQWPAISVGQVGNKAPIGVDGGHDLRAFAEGFSRPDQILQYVAGAFLGLKDWLSERILKTVFLIGKLFGRSKGEPVEITATASFVPEKMFRRATKRILAKYRVAIRKLGR
jgi:hypothetical protein